MRKNVAGQTVVFSLFNGVTRINAPTLAAGDFKVSLNGGGQVNVTTTPTHDGNGKVYWPPTQAETNGDTVTLFCYDVLGGEWDAQTLFFATDQAELLWRVSSLLDARLAAIALGVNVTQVVGSSVAAIYMNRIYSSIQLGYCDPFCTTTDIIYDPIFTFDDDAVGSLMFFYTGAATGFSRIVVSVNDVAKTMVVAPGFNTAPANNDTFLLLPATTGSAPTAATIATAVWTSAARTLTSYGTLVADVASAVWSFARRTLTYPVALITSILLGNRIELLRGDTLDLDITKLGSLVGVTNLWFTVKKQLSDADTAAELQISLTTGLTYIAGAAAATPANGSITVTDAVNGHLTIALAAVEMAKLDVDFVGYWDIQKLVGATVSTLTRGNAQVVGDATRRIV